MPLELVFQNCCEQREDPGDDVTLHPSFPAQHEDGAQCTHSTFTNLPEGDEALVHPSLQGEVTGLSETDGEEPEIPAMPSVSSPDLTSFDALDATLMRGIPLRQTLQWGAHLWLSDPRSMRAFQKARLWDASKPTKRYDKFISHTWETHGRWKQLSLLLHFGWPSMMIFWAVGAVIASVLVLLEVLPLFTVFQLPLPAIWPGIHGTSVPYGCWLMLLSLTGAMGGLVVFPYFPLASEICFLDFVCVHQTDDRKMQQGIRSIGAFLASASELRVLWSAPYLQRLWCVFELAAYRKLNPNGRIVISRIMTEVAVLLSFAWVQLVVVGFWVARSGPYGGEPWRLLVVIVCAGLPTLASMSYAAVQKQDADEELRSQLTNFDVMTVKCSSEFDRQCIHDAITRWYGSLSAFNDYIRGPFCLEVLQLRRSQRGIEGHYFIVLLLPTSSFFLEGSLAVFMSGVPGEVSISLFLAAVVCFNLMWIPSVVVLGAHLTQHGVRVGRFRLRPSLLEPLLIFVLCVILLAVGIGATVAAVANGIPAVILWNIVGLVFAADPGPIQYDGELRCLTSLVHFIVLERLDLIDAEEGAPTVLGDVLKDTPSVLTEPCLMALELMKYGTLNGDPFEAPPAIPPESEKPFPVDVQYPELSKLQPDERDRVCCTFLLCRVMSLVPMRLKNVMWDSDVDFDLAAFHALVRILKRSLRQLVEGALANILLKDLSK
ncbi:unnamed protein product, partial [Symbiodinium microadriaticum]